ncbi:MAG: hypothetical protein ACQESP_05330 [Candidatus Muiribacteriota bacterium]
MKHKIFTLLFIIILSSFLWAEPEFFQYGDVHNFWQFDVFYGEENLEEGYYQKDFTCVRVGEHTYVFVENGLPEDKIPTTSYINALFYQFEEIYPKLKEYFGEPSDLDRNNRFIILIANIRDWFYYGVEIKDEYTQPIQGYYWFKHNIINRNDFLTMDSKQDVTDAIGTMAHEFFHNIYDNVNPNPVDYTDRAVNEALAHYAVYINGTLNEDSYIQWQFSILKDDLKKGKLINPFMDTMDYFKIRNPELHHCYAAGFLFIHYIADHLIVDKYVKQNFFYRLIYEKVNALSEDKILRALIQLGIIQHPDEFYDLYFGDFKDWLYDYYFDISRPKKNE